MAIGTTTAAVIGTITAVASAAMGAYTSAQSAHNQRQQAEYQSDMADYNAQVAEGQAQLAEAEGDKLKQEAYDASLKKRQDAAKIVGSQRAAQAASGVAVDTGSALDSTLDTVEKGELDAMAIKESGAWQDYNKNVEAWSHRSQGAKDQSASQMYSHQATQHSPFLKGTDTLLSDTKKLW